MLATLLIWLCAAVVLVRNSNSDVSVVQSAKDWHAKHAACSLDVAWNRGILFQRQVRTDFIRVSLIAAEQVTKMLLTEDNDMIQAISPGCAPNSCRLAAPPDFGSPGPHSDVW